MYIGTTEFHQQRRLIRIGAELVACGSHNQIDQQQYWLYRFNYENNIRKIKIGLLEFCDKLYE